MHRGSVEMVIGSPGGGRIPLAMAQTLINILDYGLDPLEAVRVPHMSPSAGNKVVGSRVALIRKCWLVRAQWDMTCAPQGSNTRASI